MKKLIIVLNNEITPFGKVLNAVGHMMVGSGPRFPKDKYPLIEVYSATSKYVRDFRTAAYKLSMELTDTESVFSDFSHTTTDGSAKDHASQTKSIQEADIIYFAASICAEDEALADILKLVKTVDYSKVTIKSSYSVDTFDFVEPIIYPEQPNFVADENKFSITLAKLSTPDTILALIRATINLSSKADRAGLRLHNYLDSDNVAHPGMSEYGLVALAARTNNRLTTLQTEMTSAELLASGECKDEKDQLIAISLFGKISEVSALTKKGLQLWKGELISSPLQAGSMFENKPADMATSSKPSQPPL